MNRFYSLLLGSVVAVGGVTTASAQSVKTVPYSSPIAVSSSEFDDGWTAIDLDGDGYTWEPYSTSATDIGGTSSSAASKGSTGKTKDDWLISPAIQLEQGKQYRIFYGIRAESSSHPQNLDVYFTTSNQPAVLKTKTPLDSYENYTKTTFVKIDKTFDCIESGEYYLSFNLKSISDNWYMMVAVAEVYENAFTPAAVSNLKTERNSDRTQVECTLTWTLPTKDTFGGDFSADKTVEAVNIYRDGAVRPIVSLLTEDLGDPATSFVDNTDYGLEPGIHTYEVEVVVSGTSSPKASVTSKYVGPVTPATVPYTWTIADQDTFDDWTSLVGESAVNKANWTYYSYGPYGRFSNSKGEKEENYLVAPPFKIDEAGYYLVTVNAFISNTSYNSDNILQVRFGNAPNVESMTNIICDKIDFTSSSKTPYSYVVKINTPGTYYFATVAASENPQSTSFGVYSIGVEATEKTPAAVTNLKATPGDDDALEVTLTWTCPETSSNGEELLDNEYSIEVYKGSELLTTLDGGVGSYTDKDIKESGVYTYTVKTVAKGGAFVTPVTVTSPWVGPHLVSLPYSTEFKPADTTVAIWDIVDANGDGKTWHYYSNSYRCAQSDENGEEDGTRKYNDYFLTPHFDMEPGYYSMTFVPLGGTAAKPMTHVVGAVKAGSFIPERPELMQTQEYSSTTSSTYNAKTETYMFKVEEAGRYQFVFAAVKDQPVVTSTSDSYSFYGFTNVKIDAYPVRPAVATDLKAVAADDEVLEAYLTWTNPTTTNVDGLELDAITKAVIIRDGEEIAEVKDGLTPGEEASFTDNATYGLTGGPHTYSVEIYNASGKSADAAPTFDLEWVGSGLPASFTHTATDFEKMWTFIDVDNNQKSSYDGWSISGSTAMKVDETNSDNKYDDWAISPKITIEPGKYYTLTFETYIGASYKQYAPYTFDVYVLDGASADAPSVKIGEVTSVNPSGTVNDFETHLIYIVGDQNETFGNSAVPSGVNEDTEGEGDINAHIPAKTLNIGLHATQKGGVFVKTISMKEDSALGVDGIGNDTDADAVYYNLQGLKVKNPEKGIYIVVKNGKVSKQVIR